MTTIFVERPRRSGHWPFSACPDCGGSEMASLDDNGAVVFACVGCATMWRYVLGYLVSVPPTQRMVSTSSE